MRTIPVSESQSKTESAGRLLRFAMGVRTLAQSRGKSTTGWCPVDGCRIAWEQFPGSARKGQGVVFLHSAGTGSREFRPLIEHLPAGSKLVFFDWPGHGRSEDLAPESSAGKAKLTVESAAAILLNLLGQLEIEKPVLLGSGFGAAVAIRFAADHPDRPLGLILCQPSGLVSPASPEPFSQSGKAAIARLLRRMRQFAPAGSAADAASARRQILRLAVLRPMMQEARSVARLSLERSAAGLRTALDSLSCPSLFALSRHNREYPLQKYLDLLDPSLAWASQHKFTVFAGAFHPLWDEPERFSQAVTGFIQSQVPFETHTHAWLIHAVDFPTRNMNTWKCVHPDCGAERVLPVGRDANDSPPRR